MQLTWPDDAPVMEPVHLLGWNRQTVQRTVRPDDKLMLTCRQGRNNKFKRSKSAVVVAKMPAVQIHIGMAQYGMKDQPDMLSSCDLHFFPVPGDPFIFVHTQFIIPA
ncbi:hypothetical protein D3C81_1945350 [compost metagenome]